jgi:hypothetical protein
MNINSLPRELLLKIFSFITCDSIIESRELFCVCKDWNRMLTLSSLLWMHVNLSYKRIRIDKFIQIRHNILSDLVVLNLRCAFNLKHDYLVGIIDCVKVDCLKVLDISNCRQIKSSIFINIANKFKKLESLTMQSVTKVCFYIYLK